MLQTRTFLKSFNALLTEIERVKRHGFTEGELERAKKEVLSQMEKYYNERNTTESQGFAFELVRHVLTHELVPGIEHEVEIYRHYVPDITAEECTKMTQELITDKNRVITFSVPEGNGYVKPTETQVRDLMAAVLAKNIEPYVDSAPTEPLMAKAPTPGTIKSSEMVAEVGAEKVVLSNGATVYLKKTDFKADEIIFEGRSWGGQSLGPNADHFTLSTAATIIDGSGIANFNTPDLMKMLRGKNVSISPYIGMEEHGFRGSSTPKDLQTLFELLHLYFTNPRVDKEMFESWKTKMTAQLQNRDKSPDAALFDTLGLVLSDHHPRAYPMTIEELNKIDMNKAYAFFKTCFSGPENFTFTFVGNFDVDEMKSMLETYVASIPKSGAKKNWKDVGLRTARGKYDKTIKKGEDPKSAVVIVRGGDFKYTPQNRYDIMALKEVMNIKLREKLREEKGGVYFVVVQPQVSRIPTEEYSMLVYFTCAPDRVDELITDAEGVISEIMAKPVDQSYIDKTKEIQKKAREVNKMKNSFWLGSIMQVVFSNESFDVIAARDEMISKLTAEQIHTSAKKYLKKDNYALFKLVPKK